MYTNVCTVWDKDIHTQVSKNHTYQDFVELLTRITHIPGLRVIKFDRDITDDDVSISYHVTIYTQSIELHTSK